MRTKIIKYQDKEKGYIKKMILDGYVKIYDITEKEFNELIEEKEIKEQLPKLNNLTVYSFGG